MLKERNNNNNKYKYWCVAEPSAEQPGLLVRYADPKFPGKLKSNRWWPLKLWTFLKDLNRNPNPVLFPNTSSTSTNSNYFFLLSFLDSLVHFFSLKFFVFIFIAKTSLRSPTQYPINLKTGFCLTKTSLTMTAGENSVQRYANSISFFLCALIGYVLDSRWVVFNFSFSQIFIYTSQHWCNVAIWVLVAVLIALILG